METTIEALQDDRVKVSVTVDAQDIDGRIKKTYKDFAHKYNFPGFRRGKAPRPVIDNALGAEAVCATVTDDVVNETYPLAIDENNIFPIAKPDFEESGLVVAGKPYTYIFTIEVKPRLELSSYDTVEVELPPESVSDAEVEEQIEALREHYYTFEDAAAKVALEEGGSAELAMKATDDKGQDIESLTIESRTYALGAGLLPATFDKELVGLKKGDKKSFSVDVVAEGALLMSSLVGKTSKVTFDIEVLTVKTKIIPEVTDEWVKETLGFESVDELRSRVVESLSQQKSDILPRLKENACLNKLIDRLQGEVPEGMVEEAETNLLQDFFQQLQHQGMSFDNYLMQQNLTSEQFKDDVKKQALDMAKQDIALDAWAQHFDMQATDEAVTEEFVKSGVEDPKALEEEWRKSGRLHLIRQGILRSKAMQDIMDNALVKEIDFAAEAAKEEKKKEEKPANAEKAASKKKTTKKKEASKAQPETEPKSQTETAPQAEA